MRHDYTNNHCMDHKIVTNLICWGWYSQAEKLTAAPHFRRNLAQISDVHEGLTMIFIISECKHTKKIYNTHVQYNGYK
jgi:hypothetical protein